MCIGSRIIAVNLGLVVEVRTLFLLYRRLANLCSRSWRDHMRPSQSYSTIMLFSFNLSLLLHFAWKCLSLNRCSSAFRTHTIYMARYCFHFASVLRSLPTDIPLCTPMWHVTGYEAQRAKVYSPMHLAGSVYLISPELHWSHSDIPLELTYSASSIKVDWPVSHRNMRAKASP